jgi:hypothetical protein
MCGSYGSHALCQKGFTSEVIWTSVRSCLTPVVLSFRAASQGSPVASPQRKTSSPRDGSVSRYANRLCPLAQRICKAERGVLMRERES